MTGTLNRVALFLLSEVLSATNREGGVEQR